MGQLVAGPGGGQSFFCPNLPHRPGWPRFHRRLTTSISCLSLFYYGSRPDVLWFVCLFVYLLFILGGVMLNHVTAARLKKENRKIEKSCLGSQFGGIGWDLLAVMLLGLQ